MKQRKVAMSIPVLRMYSYLIWIGLLNLSQCIDNSRELICRRSKMKQRKVAMSIPVLRMYSSLIRIGLSNHSQCNDNSRELSN
jgi:hypothetical protein